MDVVLADTASEIHYLVPGKDLTLQRGEWQYLSVFPWDGKLIGVDIEGRITPCTVQNSCRIFLLVSATSL